MESHLLEQIYEAAVVPDLWPHVLGACAEASDSYSGALLVLAKGNPPRFRATPNVVPTLEVFCATDAWGRSERHPQRLIDHLGHVGFICDVDFLTPEQLERDSCEAHFRALGLGWQLGTMIPLPSGEMIAITFERRRDEGRHPGHKIAFLNGLRPDLARASLISARLGLERVREKVDTLEAIGLPAAVLTGSGRVLAANRPFQAMDAAFIPAAYGRLRLAHAAANTLMREALECWQHGAAGAARSFPVPGQPGQPPFILHMLPITRAAHDIFSGAAVLVVATVVGTYQSVPTPMFLHILFDLSPAEARLAIGLASGRSLKDVAAEGRIQFSTARSYLEQVFRKTGTRQQSQLVALLKSAQPLGSVPKPVGETASGSRPPP